VNKSENTEGRTELRDINSSKCQRSLLSSRLLSKNLKIKLYRTIILPIVLYGCETWLLTLREEKKLKVFEKMVLRCSTTSVEDRGQREWGSGDGRSLVRGSGGSCNLVQEISFHIVKFS